MKATHRVTSLIAVLFLLMTAGATLGQTTTGNEFWPKLTAAFELWPKTRIQVWGAKEDGEDFDFSQKKFGVMLTYRMKPMVARHEEIDEEKVHNLTVGIGYEYLQTDQNGSTKKESRIIAQATPRYAPGAGVLLQDRNQVEFRWNNGTYDFRYRNKLTVDRPLRVEKYRFTPYVFGELFWARNHHAWNQNQYGFGVQLPFRKLLMVDTYYLRQNCTTCNQDPLNVFGLTVNFYYKRKKKK